jgi:hypothetical protein
MDTHTIHTLQNDDTPPFKAGRVILRVKKQFGGMYGKKGPYFFGGWF